MVNLSELISTASLLVAFAAYLNSRANKQLQIRSAPARLAVSFHLSAPDPLDELIVVHSFNDVDLQQLLRLHTHACIRIENLGVSEQQIAEVGYYDGCDLRCPWNDAETREGFSVVWPIKIQPRETVKLHKRVRLEREIILEQGYALTVCGEIFQGSSQFIRELRDELAADTQVY